MAWWVFILGCAVSAVAAALAGFWVGVRARNRIRLPAFVTERIESAIPCCPVVMYHIVDAKLFERELRYLKRNGYETIHLDRLAAWLGGKDVSLPDRPIILTFDDGWESVYRGAYTLLKAFGYTAVAYVCPGLTSSEAGRVMVGMYGQALMTWDMLREVDASGVIDVQSHTWDHGRVWVSGRVIDFVRPGMTLPLVDWSASAGRAVEGPPPLGLPVLEHRPRFSAARRFVPTPEAMRLTVEQVEDRGQERFFDSPNWRDTLCDVLGGDSECCYVDGRLEAPEETGQAFRADLSRSKAVIEDRLGKTVAHLAFPWNEGGSVATRAAVELGFRTIARGRVNNSEMCRLADDPLYIPRVNSGPRQQAVLMLPGRGQRGPVRALVSAAWARIRRTLAR